MVPQFHRSSILYRTGEAQPASCIRLQKRKPNSHMVICGDELFDFIRFFKNQLFIVDFDENSMYLATSNGFNVLPHFDSSLSSSQWKNRKQQQFPFYQWNQEVDKSYRISLLRSQAISFDERDNSLFVSTKNGLKHISKQGIRPFSIYGKEVYASSFWVY